MSGIISKSPDMNSGIVGKFPTGHVLQTVSAGVSTQQSHNGTSWALKAVPVSQLITKGHYSKIFLVASQPFHAGNTTNVIGIDFRRTITGGSTTDNISGETYGLATSHSDDYDHHFHISYLDSPNVAIGVEVSYQFVWRNKSGTTVSYLGFGDVLASITLQEISV